MKASKNNRLLPILVLIVAVLFAMSANVAAKNTFDWRLVLLPSLNFKNETQLQQAEDFMPRMKAAGYNGIIIGGVLVPKFHLQSPEMKARAQQVFAAARRNGITVISMSQKQIGPEQMNPLMVEALPCKGTRFLVNSGVAVPQGDPSVSIANGDFEQKLAGWSITGPQFSIDSTIKRTGSFALRVDDPTSGKVKIKRNVALKPYTTYELSMWVKTQNVATHNNNYGDWKCRDIGWDVQSGSLSLYHNRNFMNGLNANSNWKLVKTYFHSVDRTTATIAMNATNTHHFTGTAWFDDMKIREVGLNGTIERVNMEVVVKTKTGATLTPGTDYAVGNERLTIPVGSAAKDGDELLVDWYRIANMSRQSANAAWCYEENWQATRAQIVVEDDWFGTPRVKASTLTEWRTAGWDPKCRAMFNIDAVGSGPYVANYANTISALYKEQNGARIALLYNDLFDPYHNARDNYHMVNGGNLGSGYHLSEDIIIMNWNGYDHLRKSSLKFFAGTDTKSHGSWGVRKKRNRQIISCGVWTGTAGKWLSHLDALEQEGSIKDGDVIGINFHTYKAFPDDYANIEQIAAACEAAGRWGNGPIPLPEIIPGVAVTKPGKKSAISAKMIFEVSQSPASAVRQLRFSLGETRDVRIFLFNLQGQEVSRVMDEKMVAGSYVRKIDVSKMASGVYFAHLDVAGKSMQRITRKVVVF